MNEFETPAPSRRRSAIFMDAKELAETLGVNVRTVWMWESAGKLPTPIRKGGHWTRWKREEVMAWIEDGMPDVKPDKPAIRAIR